PRSACKVFRRKKERRPEGRLSAGRRAVLSELAPAHCGEGREADADERDRARLGCRPCDLSRKAEAKVVDGKARGLGADGLEEHARDLRGSVVGNEAEKLDSGSDVPHASEQVAVTIEGGDSRAQRCVEEPGVEAHSRLVIAEENRDRAVELWRARQHWRRRIR